MRVVILAAGDFPSKGSEGERLLKAADVVVACDSAALDYKRRFRRWPTVTLGDLDSLALYCSCPQEQPLPPPNLLHFPDQETNDLSKALAYVTSLSSVASAKEGLTIVGATGKREDHTIGNVYRALEAGVRIVSDYGEFIPVKGTCRVRAWKNQGVSIFAPDPATKMTSKGLVWNLDGVKFSNPYCATLNRAAAETIVVTSDRPAYLYLERNPNAKRVVVSLGSNLGARATYLRRALKSLAALPETRLIDASSVIETEGVDVPEESAHLKFLNQVALFETTLSPEDFSKRMHAIEDKLGRVRTVRNGPRTIDLDLILFGSVKLNTPELTLPHPRYKERRFVLDPMKELGL